MRIETRELTIETPSANLPPARFGPASETELQRIAERIHHGPLDWYKAYRGNLYAEDPGHSYAIRRIPPADM